MTYEQARNIAHKYTDRTYNIRAEDHGWFRILSSPDYTIGWVDPVGNYHERTIDGWKMVKEC